MAGITGSFGLLGYRYEILPDKVTIWRPQNLGRILALFIIPAVIGWSQAFSHNFKRLDTTWFLIAGACTAFVVIGLFAFPVFGTKKVVLTRDSVLWNGEKIPPAEIVSVSPRTNVIRIRSGGYQSWSLVLHRRVAGKPKIMSLDFGNKTMFANPEPVKQLGGAVAAVLGKPLSQ